MIENADLLPRGGKVLDVACGRGRHALLMASAGFDVRAIDRNPEAIEFVRDTAERLDLQVDAEVVDLETDPPPSLGESLYDAVLVFNYLHRPLMPAFASRSETGRPDLLRDLHDAPGRARPPEESGISCCETANWRS